MGIPINPLRDFGGVSSVFVGCFLYVIGEQNQIYQYIDLTLNGLAIVQEQQGEEGKEQQYHQSILVHNLMTNIITPIWFICAVLEFYTWYMHCNEKEDDNDDDKKRTKAIPNKKNKDE